MYPVAEVDGRLVTILQRKGAKTAPSVRLERQPQGRYSGRTPVPEATFARDRFCGPGASKIGGYQEKAVHIARMGVGVPYGCEPTQRYSGKPKGCVASCPRRCDDVDAKAFQERVVPVVAAMSVRTEYIHVKAQGCHRLNESVGFQFADLHCATGEDDEKGAARFNATAGLVEPHGHRNRSFAG